MARSCFKSVLRALPCALLLGGAPALAGQEKFGQLAAVDSYDEGEAIQARVLDFIEAWESMDLKTLEFMLHNSFVSGAGENKTNYLKRLRREAANTAGREILTQWKGARKTAPDRATAKILISYTDQYKQYTGAKFYNSCQELTIDLIRWSDGKWYLLKEKGVKSACPSP